MNIALLPDRILEKIHFSASTGCWLWIARKNIGGYGWSSLGSNDIAAHRLTYQILIAPIPAEFQLDHLCRVRHCVSPMHLEPVTQRENILRGEGMAAMRAKITHCPLGHEYTIENTYLYKNRRRECKTCKRDRGREWMRAKRLATR